MDAGRAYARRMRILASTGPLFARPLDWTLGVIAEAGFDGAELMVTQDPATQDADRVTSIASAEGIGVPVLHGPFLLLTRRVFGTDPVVKARRSIALAGELGADLMVVHPPYRWQGAFHRWLVDVAEDEARAQRTRVGVENLYPVAVRGRDVRFHRYTRPEDLTGFPHVVLDTSHLGVAGVDPLAAWRLLRDRVAHLHVSDHTGGVRDSHAPIGSGVLPLGPLLREVGGAETPSAPVSITLELDCRAHLDDRTRLVAFLADQRRRCLDLLAGAQRPA
jgi:sugar phosphate isomerase/epimerase